MMRPLAVLLIAAAASSPAAAQVHKCTENGRTVYSQTPCAAQQPRDPDPVPGGRAAGDDDMRREIEDELVRLRERDAERDQPVKEQSDLNRRISHPKIAAGALSNYTRTGFPRTYAEWGDDGVVRIMKHERSAALLVAESPKCDLVELVGLSSKSRAPDDVVSFVDCRNKQRFVISAADLEVGSVFSQAERSNVSTGEAVARCQEAVRARLKFPSSASFGWLSSSAFRNETTGNVRASVEFEAMNSLGARVPHRAVCVFPVDGDAEVSISTR